MQLIGKAAYITRRLQYLSAGVRIPLRSLPLRGVFLASVTVATAELCTTRETGALEDTCVAPFFCQEMNSLRRVFSSTLYCRSYNEKKNNKKIE